MAQNLILPFMNCKVVAGYKVAAYTAYWKYAHLGLDYKSTGSLNVIASGNGKVVLAGLDNAVGNTVAIVYDDVYNHVTKKTQPLVARYMHLKSIAVKVNQIVKAGDVIGVEGKTGSGGWSEHLHVEFDTDTQWPEYSPQVAGSNLIKKSPAGYPDTTVNPSHIFHRRKDQVIVNGGQTGWTTQADWNLPTVDVVSDFTLEVQLASAKKQIAELEVAVKSKDVEITGIKQDIAALAKKYT